MANISPVPRAPINSRDDNFNEKLFGAVNNIMKCTVKHFFVTFDVVRQSGAVVCLFQMHTRVVIAAQKSEKLFLQTSLTE